MSTTEKKSKESQLDRTSRKFQVNDVVLAKIRGFPSWPGIIMDDANVPTKVKEERPVAKHRDQYTIRFFPAADYHWAFAKDLEILDSKKIDSFLSSPNRKKGDLREAYELARDPHEWNQKQNKIVRDYEESLQQAAEELEEGQDQLEEDEEDEEAGSKKRKRSSDGGKVRESADKRKKTEAARTAKPKAEKPTSASKAATNGKDESDEQLDPETKQVKDWRHKVQRWFLPKENKISPDDMAQADEAFAAIEKYDGMTAEQLRTTKIGKVFKRVMQLSDIPKDSEYHFKERAEKLCARWGAIMAGTEPPKEPAGADGPAESAHQNGDAKEEPKSEAEAPAAAAESA